MSNRNFAYLNTTFNTHIHTHTKQKLNKQKYPPILMNRSKTHTLVMYSEDLPTETALGKSWVGGSAHINSLAFLWEYPNTGMIVWDAGKEQACSKPTRVMGWCRAGDKPHRSRMRKCSKQDSPFSRRTESYNLACLPWRESDIIYTKKQPHCLPPRDLSKLLGKEKRGWVTDDDEHIAPERRQY